MKTLSIGTTGIAAFDIETLAITIKKGTRVTITGIDTVYPSRGYTLTDEHGNWVCETGFHSIIPDPSDMKILSIGTTGIAAHDIESLAITIKKGSRVTITDIDTVYPSRGYTLADEHGNWVCETGFHSIIPDPSK